MARALKISLWVVVALVAILAIAVFAVTRLIDPNDFKPEIAAAAEQHANLDLHIEGNLAWTFWPSLGVSIGRIESRIAGEEPLFAALDEAHVSVAVWPLLFGEVRMDGVRLDGVNLNLVQTETGANWEKVGPRDGTGPSTGQQPDKESAKAGGTAPAIPVSIPELAITNGRVSYRDTVTDTDILVEHLNLNARDLSLDRPFPLALSLRYQDQADIRIDLEMQATATVDPDNNVYSLDSMVLKTGIGGFTATPVNITLRQSLRADLEREALSIRDLVIQAAGTRTHGQLDVSRWSGQLEVGGELHTEPFDANAALQAIGVSPIETTDPGALSRVAVDLHLNGPPNSVLIDPLIITLDDSEIRGSAGLANLDTGKLLADLRLDNLVVDGYLPPAAEKSATTEPPAAPAGGSAPTLSEEPLLPLESLRGLLADARLRVGELQYETLGATDMEFALRARDGVITLHEGAGRALDGTFDLKAGLDASGDNPDWSIQPSVKQMQIQPAVELALDRDLLTGLLSLDADFSAEGNSEKALMESAAGTATLDLTEGTLRGINFHNVLVSGINDMLGAYQTLTAFLPAQESGKLPRELSEDTHIVDLHAESRLESQVAYVETLNAELRKGTLSGNGWLNIDNQQFDFTLGMKSPEFSDNKYFAGQTWPVRCEGELSGSPSDWCGPDSKGFRKMGKDIAARAAKDKVREKLGIEAQGDSPEEVMKNAAEEKAKEEVKKKVEDKLKDLFR